MDMDTPCPPELSMCSPRSGPPTAQITGSANALLSKKAVIFFLALL